jgi:hypothetical protein
MTLIRRLVVLDDMLLLMRLILVALLIMLIMAAVHSAHAQGTITVDHVADPFRDYLNAAIAAVIAGIVGWAGVLARKLFKVSLDSHQRAALQSALEKGARLVMDSLEARYGSKEVAISSPVIERGIQYVLKFAPGAVQHFGLTPDKLRQLIEPHLLPPASAPAPIVNVTAAPAVGTPAS